MYPFEEMTIDLITYLPHVSAGYDSVCTIVDRLSKYVYFVPCTKTISAKGLFKLFLCTIVAKHGMPCKIILDHNPKFTSRFWSALVSALGCENAKSSSHHPETDR